MTSETKEPIESTATRVDTSIHSNRVERGPAEASLPTPSAIPPMPAVVDNAAGNVMSTILRVASDPNMDVDKMERLVALHQQMKREQAEQAFNAAMSQVQRSMGRIETDKRNEQTRSNYASYGQLDRALRPLYTEHGFALSFTTEPAGEAMVRVVCYVSHEAGFTRRYEIDMPADGKGAKGNDVMTKTHATGSATQYGMRYLLKLVFNVAIGADPYDDDGNGADVKEEPVEPNSERDWINRANALRTLPAYAELRAALLAHYKTANAIPQLVRDAFNRAKGEIELSLDAKGPRA